MNTAYKRIELKNREVVTVEMTRWASIDAIWSDYTNGKIKSHVIRLKDVTFDVADIKFAKTVYYQDLSAVPEHQFTMSDEERKKNIRKMQAYQYAVKRNHKFVPQNDEERQWVVEFTKYLKEGIYPESDWRNKAGITKRVWNECRGVFNEVLFDSIEHEQETVMIYFRKYVKGGADPRGFDMYAMVNEARNNNGAEDLAKQIFEGAEAI